MCTAFYCKRDLLREITSNEFLTFFISGSITLLGLAIGGIFWGGLGDRLGRRRSLLTAMSVHALFSGVTTFMPTYGTFMSTKFISSIG